MTMREVNGGTFTAAARRKNANMEVEKTPSPYAKGDEVTKGMPDHNCWDPRKIGVKPGSKEWADSQVRSDVKTRLDALTTSDCTSLVHTTRSIQKLSIHTPKAPQPFSAGRFHAVFQDQKTGRETGLVVETEQKVGHLGRVVPGRTDVGGYIAVCGDPQDPWKNLNELRAGEADYMIDKLYERFKAPMTDAQADTLQGVLSFAYAVRYSGEGEAAVTARHTRALAG